MTHETLKARHRALGWLRRAGQLADAGGGGAHEALGQRETVRSSAVGFWSSLAFAFALDLRALMLAVALLSRV